MLPEDGRRPKHVGAFKYFNVSFLNTESISAFVGFFFENRDKNYFSSCPVLLSSPFPIHPTIDVGYYSILREC
jgi:hypothetical protein